MRSLTYLTILLLLLPVARTYSQNLEPVISGLYAWADVSNNVLHVYYDVADNEGEDVEIFFGISSNDTVFSVSTAGVTGDVGYPVTAGVGKEIVWDYGISHPNILDYQVRVTADDRYQVDIQSIVDQVDTMNLYQDLQWMSAGVRDHNTGLPLLMATKDSITARFNAFGFEVNTQPFFFTGDSGYNVIGRKPGVVEDSVVFINDAHYDGVPAGPGADDNGSGVVGFLEVARILTPYNFRNSIRFIGFDMEEDGLVGSYNYVYNGGIRPWEEIAGVFNYEMIGYYSERPNSQQLPTGFDIIFPDAADSLAAHNGAGDFITNVGSDSAIWLKGQYDSISRVYVPELRVISLIAPGNGAATVDLRRSDHAHFWDAGIEALMLTDGANFRNINYHTPNDVLDSLNFDFMGNNVKAVVANLCVLAGIQHSDVAYIDVSPTPLTMRDIELDAAQLYIYPNPGKGKVLIKVEGLAGNPVYDLEIVDESGRIVIRESVDLSRDGMPLDVSKWARGVYNVIVRSSGLSLSQNMILQ